MDEKDPVFLFDTLYTTNHIQMLKVLFAYLPASVRENLAIMVKLQELQYTMQYLSSHKISAATYTCDSEEPDFNKLFEDICPYCTSQEKKQLKKLTELKSNMEKMQEMMKIMPLIEELFQENGDSFSGDINPVLKNLMSEEQLSMFEMFSQMSAKKEES